MESITALQGANLAKLVYSDLQKGSIYGTTTVLDFYTDPTTDLQMALLQVGDSKVVAFRGTESELDMLTNLDMYVYLEQAGVAHQFIQAGVTLSQWISDYGLSSNNTTIVGHSLGGALAQYFGVNTQFETLTYNAYGIGKELSGSSNNITNYITMHDPVSILPGSQMVGTTYMLQDENLTAVLGHGISNFTSSSSWVRGYSLVGSPDDIDVIYSGYLEADERRIYAQINGSKDDVIYGGNINNLLIGGGGNDYLEGGNGFDTLQGGAGHDVLLGGNDSDVLYGGEGQDTLIGGDNDNASDALFGGSGADVLLGGGGDDTLAGGDASNLYADKELDYLAGGVGHDIYYVSHQDIINDADSTGLIMFNDKSLSGTKTKVDEYTYEDANFTYTLNGPNMIVVDKNLGEYITIENMNFNNASGMGMEFDDGSETDPNKKDIEIYVGDATVTEGGTLEFTIGIDNTLDEDLVVNVSTYFNGSANSSDLSGTTNGTITIKAGTTYGTFEIATLDDTIVEPTENFIFAVTGLAEAYGGDDMNSFLIKNAGEGRIENDDVPEQVYVTVSDASRIEINGEMQFTVSLVGSLNAGETLTVNLSTYDISATGGSDYGGVSGSVTFNSSSTTQTFSVPIIDDNNKESDETFYLAPTSFSYNGVKEIILDNAGVGTILDDDENGDVSIEVSDVTANEGDTAGQSAEVTVSISSALSNDIVVSISYGGFATIAAGSTSGSATISWDGDTTPEEDAILNLEILGFSYAGDESIVFGHGADALITDDDEDGDGHPMDPANMVRRDPLVLDIDKDGFISTTSIQDTSIYFDLTGDGIKEKVGWIKANDGLVAYDKNENGKIDGINEVFGNETTSGFDELRLTADSNYDGVIDRRDELYSRLKVWQDTNQDGYSQEDELVSLSEAGVKSIDLNVAGTNIEVNGNLITEASHYTDSDGNLELAADVELALDTRITKIDTSTIEGYTEYDESKTLPNLRGYGIVSDSYITYNIDENFRTLALEFGSDISKVANDFESYMDGWSGYTKMQRDLQTKYGLDTPPKLSDLDRKVWTYEHFMGTGSFSVGIEQRLETTAKAMQSGGSDTASAGRYNDAVVNSVYDSFTDRNRAFFSLKAFYPDVLSDALYEYGLDEYVITDQAALSAKVSAYINNPDNTLQEKLYLVSQMNTLQGTFLDFNAESITSNIDDTLVKNLVTSIYNDTLNAHVYDTDGIYFHEGELTDIDVSSTSELTNENVLILGTDAGEVIVAKATSATVLAGKGDDSIYGYTGNNTYIYRTGDGTDTIVDGGGNDTLNFSDISLENVIIKAQGKDLIIAVAEDGKTFNELVSRVIISNWIDSDNRIENIIFSDGSSPNFIEIIQTHFISNASGNIDLTNDDDTIEMLGGNDTVNALGGNDTVDGGAGDDTILAGDGNDTLIGGTGSDALQGGNGNDTYMYSRGDGSDTIIDSSGNDTLRFAEGIASSDLVVRMLENGDMQIALKEDGKTFEELADKITPHVSQNYTLLSNINLFQQDVLSQSLKKDIINNSFFIFKNTLHVEKMEVA